MVWLLVVVLIVSLTANVYQYHRWQTYRTKPAGNHSWTGKMPKVTRVEVALDKAKLKRESMVKQKQ